MEESRSKFTKRLGIAATVVSFAGGALPDLTGMWRITLTPEKSEPAKRG